ncbi:fungal-specific transcription factor domain-containing protein [Aspergillus karnatakaensis]|uniref:transcription factor domain-containing protein n=1 Tax=Aspergillus karnatakaensis TaxID=1810916 RepID=UPI003CCDEB03
MSSPSPYRRGGRLRRACDLCQQKKIRCDYNGEFDCETCRLAGVQCTLTRKSPPVRKSTRERLAEATAKIRELEALLTVQRGQKLAHTHKSGFDDKTITLTDDSSSGYLQDPHDLSANLAMFQNHIAFCGVGAAGSAKRNAVCSTVYQQTSCHLNIDSFLRSLPNAFGPWNSEKVLTQKWPSNALVQLCINEYLRTGLYSVFPIANTEVLQALLDDNILERQRQSTPVANVACVVAFTALITELHRLEPEFSDADPDAYLRAVLALLPQLITEDAGLRTLETITVIFVYLIPLGHTPSADLLLAVAARIIYRLGGHRYSVIREPEGKHLRALFWLCYCLDKELSIRFGRPPSINDIDCDLRLPDNYIVSWSDDRFLHRPLSSQRLLYPSDLRLSMIKSRIYTLLYSEQGRAQPEARRLQYIRELDKELNDLKFKFPESCWPDIFATEEVPDYTFHDLSLHGVNLHLEYYFCLGKIHGAGDYSSQSSPQGWSFLPSSAELVYQESRTMLVYVSRIRRFLNWHTFWLHAQFILTAVVSLFWHLVTSPNAPSFNRDIQVLEKIAETFSELDRESRATRRFAPFFFTTCLTKKLVFLAKQAYTKANSR